MSSQTHGYVADKGRADSTAALRAADGTAVLDRPIPRWWKRGFVLTAAFGMLYMLFYMPGLEGRGLIAAYDAAVAENLQKQFGSMGVLEPDAATILKYMDDPEWRDYGKTVFARNCATCHGQEGVGGTCPNLTDDAWIHVKRIEDIAKVITLGAKNGQMPPWINRLHPNEIVFVSAYVASLRGKSTGGKPPERDAQVIPPWPKLGGPQ